MLKSNYFICVILDLFHYDDLRQIGYLTFFRLLNTFILYTLIDFLCKMNTCNIILEKYQKPLHILRFCFNYQHQLLQAYHRRCLFIVITYRFIELLVLVIKPICQMIFSKNDLRSLFLVFLPFIIFFLCRWFYCMI